MAPMLLSESHRTGEVGRFWRELKEHRPHTEIVEHWRQGCAPVSTMHHRDRPHTHRR